MKQPISYVLAAAVVLCAAPAFAQPSELAQLRAEVAAQQAAMAKLLERIDALERQLGAAATKAELETGQVISRPPPPPKKK